MQEQNVHLRIAHAGALYFYRRDEVNTWMHARGDTARKDGDISLTEAAQIYGKSATQMCALSKLADFPPTKKLSRARMVNADALDEFMRNYRTPSQPSGSEEITMNEIAQRMGITKAAVRYWRGIAEMGFPEPSREVGARLFYRRAEVQEWAARSGRTFNG